MVLQHLHPGEEDIEVRLDDLVDQNEVIGLDLDEAGKDRRHLHPREPGFPGLGVAQAHGDGQAQRRDVRKRMARIDGKRREDRVDLVEKSLAQRLVVLGDRGVVDDLDAFAEQGMADLGVRRAKLLDEFQDTRTGGGDLLGRRPAIGR